MVQEVFLRGDTLYADDFNHQQILQWWKEEESGYYDLTQNFYPTHSYEYHALNAYYGWRHLASKQFGCCLALGCADGADVAPIASQVEDFLCVEPAEKWWTNSVGGKPARFVKPAVDGTLPVSDGQIDLLTAFAVLHHIPNVSYLISEVSRVLSPGGIFLFREPIITMGDWTKPRPGLTKNERGLPLPWLQTALRKNNLHLVRKSLCFFPGITQLADKLRLGYAYGSPAIVRLDSLLSRAFSWNVRYHRPTLVSKIAPRCIFGLAQKK